MKTMSVAFVLTGLLAVTLAYPLRNSESEEREALVQMLLRNLIGGKTSHEMEAHPGPYNEAHAQLPNVHCYKPSPPDLKCNVLPSLPIPKSQCCINPYHYYIYLGENPDTDCKLCGIQG